MKDKLSKVFEITDQLLSPLKMQHEKCVNNIHKNIAILSEDDHHYIYKPSDYTTTLNSTPNESQYHITPHHLQNIVHISPKYNDEQYCRLKTDDKVQYKNTKVIVIKIILPEDTFEDPMILISNRVGNVKLVCMDDLILLSLIKLPSHTIYRFSLNNLWWWHRYPTTKVTTLNHFCRNHHLDIQKYLIIEVLYSKPF